MRLRAAPCLTVLLLSACGSPPPQAPPSPPAGDALRTRLVCETPDPRVGAPLLLRLELENASGETWHYDDQQVAVNDSLEVTGPDGAAVPYVGGSYQTGGGARPLAPGASVVLFERLDLARQYPIDRPGRYQVRFRGAGLCALPERQLPPENATVAVWASPLRFPSPTIAIEVGPGAPSERDVVTRALQPVLPERWEVASYDQAPGEDLELRLMRRPESGLKRDVEAITLRFGPGPARDGEERLGRRGAQDVHATFTPGVARAWPDHRERLAEALGLE